MAPITRSSSSSSSSSDGLWSSKGHISSRSKTHKKKTKTLEKVIMPKTAISEYEKIKRQNIIEREAAFNRLGIKEAKQNAAKSLPSKKRKMAKNKPTEKDDTNDENSTQKENDTANESEEYCVGENNDDERENCDNDSEDDDSAKGADEGSVDDFDGQNGELGDEYSENEAENDGFQEEQGKNIPRKERRRGKNRLNAALTQILEKGDENILSVSINGNNELIFRGDSACIDDFVDNETLVNDIKKVLLDHIGRKNYKFIEKSDKIADSLMILPPLSKSIDSMKKLEVRTCCTVYLQKLGYGNGGIKKYGKPPVPLWWPVSPDWNVEWATWQGPTRTTVGDLKTLVSSMVNHFKLNMINQNNANDTDSD